MKDGYFNKVGANSCIRGIGGALGVLVFVLICAIPLYRMSQWQKWLELGIGPVGLGFWLWAISVISVVLSLTAGIMLVNKQGSSAPVKVAHAAIWWCMFGESIAVLMVAGDLMNGNEVGQSIGGIVCGFFVAFAWSYYLSVSRRVRNTYFFGVNLLMKEAREETDVFEVENTRTALKLDWKLVPVCLVVTASLLFLILLFPPAGDYRSEVSPTFLLKAMSTRIDYALLITELSVVVVAGLMATIAAHLLTANKDR
jgi:hypothetical protein